MNAIYADADFPHKFLWIYNDILRVHSAQQTPEAA